MVDYATRLDAAIKYAKSSARQLSLDLGVSYQAVKKVLDGKSTALNAENHVRAARHLGVNSYWLATGEEQMITSGHAAPPIPMSQYRVAENVASGYSWPFKNFTSNDIKKLPDRKIGQIEGYISRVFEEDKAQALNGTTNNKS